MTACRQAASDKIRGTAKGRHSNMTALEERVARLEGGYEHLATKADLERAIGNIRGDIVKAVIGLAMLQLVGLASVAAITQLLR